MHEYHVSIIQIYFNPSSFKLVQRYASNVVLIDDFINVKLFVEQNTTSNKINICSAQRGSLGRSSELFKKSNVEIQYQEMLKFNLFFHLV